VKFGGGKAIVRYL